MIKYGRTPADVVAWPLDRDAHAALEEYLNSLPTDPDATVPSLSGDLLDFRGADLSGLELLGAYLFNSCLAGVRLVGASLGGATLSGADLRGADLTAANAAKIEAEECLAEGAVFRSTNLFSANLNRADLNRCDFRGALLNSATLYGTDLRYADLRGALMRYCSFGTESAPTQLEGARIHSCAVDQAHGVVSGQADIGDAPSELVDGGILTKWFNEHGASGIVAKPNA